MSKAKVQDTETVSLFPLSELCLAVATGLAVSWRRAVAIVGREIQRKPIDLFLGRPGDVCVPAPIAGDKARHLLSQLGCAELSPDSAGEVSEWQILQLRKSDAKDIQLNIEATAVRLPEGARMKGRQARQSWNMSHMVSADTLCQAVAGFNQITLKESAHFLWSAISQDEVGFSLYSCDEALPVCIGYAAWVSELDECTQMREPEKNTLAEFFFDPVDAETIFMRFPFSGGRTPSSTGVFSRQREQADTRESKEYRNEVFRIKAAEGEASTCALLVKLANDRPKDFVRWCCHLVLNEATESNPLERFFSIKKNDWTADQYQNRYGYLARTTLRKIAEKDIAEHPVYENSDRAHYVSLLDAVYEEMHPHFWDFLPARAIDVKGMRRFDLIWHLFAYIAEALQLALAVISEKVWHGVPLYCRDATGGFRLADVNDENLVYLRMCGKHDGMAECAEPPSWFVSYFLSRKDLEVHSWLFSFDTIPTDAQVAERRDAFSKQLGLPTPVLAGAAKPVSSLLGFVETVQRRWYGPNFDPLDRDTFPKQTDVVGWLMTEHVLSKRQAEAIDIVTRPDHARRG
jgi:hypothetical protein